MKFLCLLGFSLFSILLSAQSFSFKVQDACVGDSIPISFKGQQIDSIKWEASSEGRFLKKGLNELIFIPKVDIDNSIEIELTITGIAFSVEEQITASTIISIFHKPAIFFQVNRYSNVAGRGLTMLDSSVSSLMVVNNYLPASVYLNAWTDDYSKIDLVSIDENNIDLPKWKYVVVESDFEFKIEASNIFG